MKTLIFILIANLGFAQIQSKKALLQPTIGLSWIGGFQYQMEVEAPGAQIGLKYTPKKSNLLMTDVKFSADYYFDVIPEKPNTRNDFYNLRLQFSKPFAEFWSIQYYGGYANALNGNIMQRYSGPFKTNFSYGIGIQTSDDMIDGEAMFQMMAGYPMLSIGVTYKFKSILKKEKRVIKHSLKPRTFK